MVSKLVFERNVPKKKLLLQTQRKASLSHAVVINNILLLTLVHGFYPPHMNKDVNTKSNKHKDRSVGLTL